jgi:LysM repeat protein
VKQRPRLSVKAGAFAVTGFLCLTACGLWGANKSEPTTTPATLPSTTTLPATTTEPPTTVPSEYIVQKGDSLTRIAKQFGVTVAQLVAANNLPNADHIEEGQRLTIPPTTIASTTTTRPAPPTTAKRP